MDRKSKEDVDVPKIWVKSDSQLKEEHVGLAMEPVEQVGSSGTTPSQDPEDIKEEFKFEPIHGVYSSTILLALASLIITAVLAVLWKRMRALEKRMKTLPHPDIMALQLLPTEDR